MLLPRTPKRPSTGLILGALLLLTQLSLTATAHGSFEFTAPRWDSATTFLELARKQLGRDRVVLGASIDWSSVTAQDAVLLLHPTAAIDATEASAFLSAGGRLAIVDDFGSGDQLLGRFHIQRTSAPLAPKEMYQENPRLPLARPVETQTASGITLKHPMVATLDHVVTNHPSAFSTAPNVELTPVLTLTDRAGAAALFAVIGVIGDGAACGLNDGVPKNAEARCGRLFAMADASVFIDLMMKFDGNRALASGLVSYLLEDDGWGKRSGKLYILANTFEDSGHFGGQAGLAREVRRVFDNLEAMLAETEREGLPSQWSWLLAVCAVLGAAAFAWQSSGRLYRRPTPRYARPQPLSAQPGAPGRAAVLSAPSTHHTLVLLELKAAAEEFLREALDLPRVAGSATILEALTQQGSLSRESIERLRDLFQQMERAEKALVGSENLRISADSVRQLHEQLAMILSQVSGSRAILRR